jgi:uncharacterized protein (DUF362 family)
MILLEKVSIVKVFDVDKAVRKSVELIGGFDADPNSHIIIKPNLCNEKNPESMVLTDFRIIKTVIDMAHANGNDITIVESDNISGSAERRVIKSGLMRYLNKWGVDFLNLSKDKYERFQVANTILKLPKTVIEADYFINLPKIKTCAHTLVTLSIKNLYGVFQRKQKRKLHKRIDEVLLFLAEKVRNDLIIVDGIYCMEGNGPVIGNPLCLNLVLAGRNPVSVDTVGSILMGYDPNMINHIALCSKMGFGPIDINNIEIMGENLRNNIIKFEPPYSLKATIKSIKTFRNYYF